MSTRCLLGIKEGDIYRYSYCHYDGYPEGVGKTLIDHYNSLDKIEILINRGDMSSLEPTIEKIEFYEAYGDNCCNIHMIPDRFQEFIYVYENNKWKYYEIPSSYDDVFYDINDLKEFDLRSIQ